MGMNVKELNQAIQTYVRTETFPVGVKIVKEESALPAKAKRPQRDFGYQITICQAVSFSRRYGWSIAMNGSDLSCPIAQVAFGYEEQLPFYTEGNLACGMYTDTLDAGVKSEQDVPKFTAEESGYYVSFPLERAEIDPQVIVPCYGDRLFAQTQDHEMAFSFHFRNAAELVEGLAGTQKGGIRFPIPSYLRYQAEFPPTYQKLAGMFGEGKGE
jgi:uncharacterized protein (DUF169 family)